MDLDRTPIIGLLLSDDLIFTSRITGTASALGLTMKAATSVQNLQALAKQHTPRCVILDLANPGLVIEHLFGALRENFPDVRVVAYGSHVDTATLRRAREAGCDPVLPRSKFVEDLQRELPNWFSDGGTP